MEHESHELTRILVEGSEAGEPLLLGLLFDLRAKGLEVGVDSAEDFEDLGTGFCGDFRGGSEFLHGGDDDADEEVEDGEGGDDDEGNEEDPGEGVGFHDGADDAHGPS